MLFNINVLLAFGTDCESLRSTPLNSNTALFLRFINTTMMTKIHYKNATYAATLRGKIYVLYLPFSIRKSLVFIVPIYYCWSEKPLFSKPDFSFYPQWPFWKSQVTNDIAWGPEISDQWKIGCVSALSPLSRDLTKCLKDSPGKMTNSPFCVERWKSSTAQSLDLASF